MGKLCPRITKFTAGLYHGGEVELPQLMARKFLGQEGCRNSQPVLGTAFTVLSCVLLLQVFFLVFFNKDETLHINSTLHPAAVVLSRRKLP